MPEDESTFAELAVEVRVMKLAKFSISYTRKVQSQPYENVTISLTREFDEDETPYDHAFMEVRSKVDAWIKAELRILGLD